MNTLNTPLKRFWLLVMILGVIALTVNFFSWLAESSEHKIVTINKYYNWVEIIVDAPLDHQLMWKVDAHCANPFLEKRKQNIEKELSEHIALEPVEPPARKTPYRSRDIVQELKNNAKYAEALKLHNDWSTKLYILKIRSKNAFERLNNKAYRGVREREQTPSEKLIESLYKVQIQGKPSIQRKPAVDAPFKKLVSEFGLSGFTPAEQKIIYQDCVIETEIFKVLAKTKYYFGFQNWLDDRPLSTLFLGVLTILGLIGSLAYNPASKLCSLTLWKLVKWIKEG